jgi:predicted Zn-dependent peptidase
MNEDDPEDVAHEAFADALMPNTSLGRPIGGSPESIKAVTRERVFEHYLENYSPSSLVITAAGGLKHEELVELVSKQLAEVGWTANAAPMPRRQHGAAGIPSPEPMRLIKKDVQQANVLLGHQSFHAMDDQRYALGIMNTILGGGMSSRLYQEIREDRGLAYSTYSYQHGYSDAGFFGMYAGCNPENAALVVDLMRQGLDGIAQSGVTDHEFELALGNITGGLALRFEGTLSRMNRLMGAELGSGEWLSVEEVLERFRAVTKEEVQQVAQRISAMPQTLVAVGSALDQLEKRA